MRVSLHAGTKPFLAAAEGFVREDPFSTNVIAVIASAISAGTQPEMDSYLWATVEDGEGRVVGVAMQTPPHALSRMPDEAAATLAGALVDAGRDLPGVNGAAGSTTAFAQTWSARTGQTSRVVTAMCMYHLGHLVRPANVPGSPQVAAPDHIELIASWLAAFHDEAMRLAPVEEWRAFADRRITAKQVHLWHDEGAPVALAAVSAPAAGVARVGPVYTPPERRRRGYGAAVTAQATAGAMSGGARHVVARVIIAASGWSSTNRSISSSVISSSHAQRNPTDDVAAGRLGRLCTLKPAWTQTCQARRSRPGVMERAVAPHYSSVVRASTVIHAPRATRRGRPSGVGTSCR
jgi:predicted GNAT family acetyltransferase